jgi:hypothetical protein
MLNIWMMNRKDTVGSADELRYEILSNMDRYISYIFINL